MKINWLDDVPRILNFMLTDPVAVWAILRYSKEIIGQANDRKILVGMHHKALTIYMLKIFRVYSLLTRKNFSMGQGEGVDYLADILMDHHSEFNFEKLRKPFRGVHVYRDPRDLVVSSVFYHQKSEESWLHVKGNWIEGYTYQEYILGLDNIREKILFEMEYASKKNINDMLSWTFSDSIVEFKYEDLISDQGFLIFRRGLEESAAFSECEINLLAKLFELYALDGPLSPSDHVRNPNPGQWKQYFDNDLKDEFELKFPGCIEKLGYSW